MKLSIVTVNYNNAEGLERTIKSVVSQTFRDFEYIIIDGGSTDSSTDVIKQYEEQIDYWVSEKDGGIYPGMNKGFRKTKGEYVNFMNSGDCFHSSDVLEKIFALNTNADIITGAHWGSPHPNVGKYGVTMLDLYTGAIDHQASFIRRSLALNHPYDEKYKIVSDWKFFIEALIIDNCSFFYTDIIIVDVDMTGISNTNHELNKKEREAVLNELFPKRILDDYRYIGSIHPDILKTSLNVCKSQIIKKTVMAISLCLLKIRDLYKCTI
jgi:glycosyltransferase involved in cell wall biosynthesis